MIYSNGVILPSSDEEKKFDEAILRSHQNRKDMRMRLFGTDDRIAEDRISNIVDENQRNDSDDLFELQTILNDDVFPVWDLKDLLDMWQ